MTQKQFTLKDALDIQAQQIEGWKIVLNEKTYLRLIAEAQRKNRQVENPYLVFRGTDIDQFVHDIMNHERNKSIRTIIS